MTTIRVRVADLMRVLHIRPPRNESDIRLIHRTTASPLDATREWMSQTEKVDASREILMRLLDAEKHRLQSEIDEMLEHLREEYGDVTDQDWADAVEELRREHPEHDEPSTSD